MQSEIQSDVSWDLVCDKRALFPDEGPCCTSGHHGHSLIELIRSNRWRCALALLRGTEPWPLELAHQCDQDGDSPLAWAAYKATSTSVCLEVVCALISAYPAALQRRGKNRFLPLHEAAWGNAPAAIATAICAAWPDALADTGPGQTPHEVGQYYHAKYRRNPLKAFAWPERKQMLDRAAALGEKPEWLEPLLALRLPSVSALQLLSVPKLEKSYALPHAAATLVMDLVHRQSSGCSGTKWISIPAAIPEESAAAMARATGRRLRLGRRRTSRGNRLPGLSLFEQARRRARMLARAGAPQVLSEGQGELDEVEYTQEGLEKQRGRWAGAANTRHRHYASTQASIFVDGNGVLHHVTSRVTRVVIRQAQRSRRTQNWPSRVRERRERAVERSEKAHQRGAFLCMVDVPDL